MSERVTPVRVFISSPGDLFPEREVVKQVVEERKTLLKTHNS